MDDLEVPQFSETSMWLKTTKTQNCPVISARQMTFLSWRPAIYSAAWMRRAPAKPIRFWIFSDIEDLKALNKGYPFSHNRSGKWPSPKWKETIILKIHPFSTEQWLWEEGILSLRTNSQGHLKNGGLEDEGFLFSGAEGKPGNSGANLLLVSGSVWWWWKEIPSIGLNLSLKARHLGVGFLAAPSLWQWVTQVSWWTWWPWNQKPRIIPFGGSPHLGYVVS